MQFYWQILLYDGSTIDIPPDAVETVRRKWKNKEPIDLNHRSIPSGQIKDFSQSDKIYSQQPLLEAASQAFNEPVINPDESIASRWVKKAVTGPKWDKHYSAHPAYRRLGEENGMVMVAFRLPIHAIDVNKTPYCTEQEVEQLQVKH